MSMTGSLMGYENNNEINQLKCNNKKYQQKSTLITASSTTAPLPMTLTSTTTMIASTPITTTNVNTTTTINTSVNKQREYASNLRRSEHMANNNNSSRNKRETCNRGHANGLWSVWYGIFVVTLQAYIATRCAKRFVAYLSLPWPTDVQPPKFELHVCIVLTGTGVLLLPILLAAAFLKLGNLANDGIKLGRHTSTCTRDPPATLLGNNAVDNGLAGSLWKHGGPTAAFVHLCTAMCFLLPSLLMEARLIYAGFLPKDAIWRTDLDWIVVHRDRLIYLNFMNPSGNININNYTTNSTYNNNININNNNPFLITNIEESNLNNDNILNTTSGFNATNPLNFTISSTTKINNNNNRGSTEFLIKNDHSVATSPIPIARNKKVIYIKTRDLNLNDSKIDKDGDVKKKINNMTAYNLPYVINSISDLDRIETDTDDDTHDERKNFISLEYLNYAMALAVYSVRYPAVFWSCNKAIGTIFSIQLFINSVQSLISYAGMSVLYKVQVLGPHKVLNLVRNRVQPTPIYSSRLQKVVTNLFGDTTHLLLNPHVTLALFALSSLLILCSSMVTYLYAYGRFATFLEHEHQRRVIISKEGRRNSSGWAYFTHCAALCVFLALVICNAPLLYDYTVVYRGSLDGVILACILGTIAHLFLWLIFWFFLTIKRNWIFKVRVTIARATVRSARSVKLVTDVDLLSCRRKSTHKSNSSNDDDDNDDDTLIDHELGSDAPLLIVGDGKTYSIAESSPKKAIMCVIQKAIIERKAKQNEGLGATVNRASGETSLDGEEEQIYWLRPKLRPSPEQSPNGGTGGASTLDKSWLNKKLRPKVTFNDLPSTSGSRNKGKRRGNTEGGPDDDGDYATLRELPLMTGIDPADDSTSEENKLLECVNDDQVTYYASGNRDLHPSEGDPSPLLTPEPLPDPNLPIVPVPLPIPMAVTNELTIASTLLTTSSAAPVLNYDETVVNDSINHPLPQANGLPRCLRHADSGMSQDQLTPRSDSSNSPAIEPLTNGVHPVPNYEIIERSNTSSNSESSSGVHSNISNVSNSTNVSHPSINTQQSRRATSVDDLTVTDGYGDEKWRSCSLQRGIQPPNQNYNSPGPGSGQTQFTKFNTIDRKSSKGGPCPAIILENTSESTVVIRRRMSRPKLPESWNPNDPEPFSRSTNMRMTSFTENSDIKSCINGNASATLPHYPTQPIVPAYPHCSTMPLPHGVHSANNVSGATGTGGSCGSVPQQNSVPIIPIGAVNHTTLPTTLAPNPINGRCNFPTNNQLVNQPVNGGYVKRYPINNVLPVQTQQWSLPTGHHTFPQPLQNKFFGSNVASVRVADRDSANFSMASSGDSDICHH
ncbi:protein tincar isoform X1 [Microplitis demolitor]|uniref:protein tincar isoform X1 n=1 Tax=Microplitis demolitor TaxID=69319 RepID=UPI0004CCCF43|nr:protein tincar isoform X1 [Microplitis demolitor]